MVNFKHISRHRMTFALHVKVGFKWFAAWVTGASGVGGQGTKLLMGGGSPSGQSLAREGGSPSS